MISANFFFLRFLEKIYSKIDVAQGEISEFWANGWCTVSKILKRDPKIDPLSPRASLLVIIGLMVSPEYIYTER